MDSKHVRIKLIALHEAEAGVASGAKLNRGITMLALNIANKRVRNVWNIDLGSVSKNYDLSDLYMIDYVLDLTKPKVAAAYNDLMQKKAVFKPVEMALPVSQRNLLQSTLVTDFSEFETLYKENKEKPEKDRDVNRLFEGTTVVQSAKTGFNFNISAFRLNRETFFSRNKIETKDSNEKPVHYLFDTFIASSGRKMPLHLFDRSELVNSNLLFTATENYNPVAFVGLFLSREIRAQSLSHVGLEKIRNHLRTTLPAHIFAQIPIDHWDLSGHEGVNVYFKHEVFLSSEALKAVPNHDPVLLKQKYQEFLSTLPTIDAVPNRAPNPFQENDMGPFKAEIKPTANLYDFDLDTIVKQISIIFEPKTDISELHEAFIKLKNNDLFVKTGAGFLIYLLPQDRLNDLIGYSMILSGKDLEKIPFNFGKPTQTNLYHSMLYIQDLLNYRTVNLRLLEDIQKTSAQQNSPAIVP